MSWERVGTAAGLRMHMLVAPRSALLVVASHEARMSTSDLSRVIQGIATGIGFIGAGAILESPEEQQVHGDHRRQASR